MIQHIRRTAGLAACLLAASWLLAGCAGLLERSYGVAAPYADRYWDSSAEDTLRAETYQDLVNSILLLIEQQAEDGVIRCYGEADSYQKTLAARGEVRQETMLGSYLLEDLQVSYESGAGYSTITCHMTYREDAEDVGSLMTLSDSQSLVDLLRLAVREDYEKLTAHFAYDPPREDVTAAVESFWQELCQNEMGENALLSAGEDAPVPGPAEEDGSSEATSPEGDSQPEETPVPEGESGGEGEPPEEDAPPPEKEPVPADGNGDGMEEPPEESPIVYPPCPWLIRFYPDQETAKIVEVLLKE